MLRNVLTLGQISRKAISAAPRRQIANKVKEKQQAFQKDDDLPVHLKGGLSDVLLYRFTLLLCVFGVGSMIRDFSRFSKS
ncbi:cytochrome c oxidase subunit 7A2, mitochondrial isoform X2 [Pogona vitticeps]|uniref:Cytochrome c oxidase subunit 7A2, mitochondrial n=1 Tax=Pogona vitticeps TaxID=103695 RepID=A0A6J0SYR6_9SAUR|nr:cytochrome c oxidase subunit 7A2, mitochondrial [Pogona vitticeps]